MWLNEHRRGPGWKRFLSVRRQHRFLLVLLPKRCGRGAPGAERLPPEDASPGASSGPWSVAPGGTGARGLQGSRAPLQGPAYPLARRASAAAGAAPQEPPPRTVLLARAGGGGGGAGPLKSAARLPDPPAPAPLWSRLGCGKVASRLRLWLRALDPAPPTAPSVSGTVKIHFSWSVHAGLFLLPFLFLYFSSCHCDVMALVILDHTEVKPLIKILKKHKKLLRPMVSGVFPPP